VSILTKEAWEEAEARADPVPSPASRWERARRLGYRYLPETGVLVAGAVLRFWRLTAIGFNSDETVYAGTAAAISGDPSARSLFPVFRAHPLLFQLMVSLAYRIHHSDWAARAVPSGIGVLAVAVTILLGWQLYGRGAGLAAGALLAVMPYHVIVSRQVLLDGLLTLGATGALYCSAWYVRRPGYKWMVATGAVLGLTMLTKETAIVLIGGLYAFFSLTSSVRVRLRHVAAGVATGAALAAVAPLVLYTSGRANTGQHYLLWQMFRRPNHPLLFYAATVPAAVGTSVLVAAVAGLIWLRQDNGWREHMVLCWIVVPVVFFTLWPVKGYQYLLPIAPALAVLAGRTLARLGALRLPRFPRRVGFAVAAGVVVTLVVPSLQAIDPAPSRTFLAGTGGVPGGREAGRWLRGHAPAGTRLLTIGPSMANVLQFYSRLHARALSVSSNPGSRNPAYVPVPNPDLALRTAQFQYLVWDSYTASRTHFFAAKARALIDKYHGVAVYTATVQVRARSGTVVTEPVVIVYQVRP
jgi:Dolichyl-phosphate-mannose-protein mannosyltransferase